MPWYEEFFDEDYIQFHLRGGAWLADRTPVECDFVMQALGLQEGARVLDLCCGQGRHAIELARRGMNVTGADLSEYLLGLARQAASDAGVSVDFRHCDARELPWLDEFDAVIVMFTAFGYFDDDSENECMLHAAAQALKPGGRLLLDLPDLWHWARRATTSRDWLEIDGRMVLEEHRWDVVRSRLIMDRVIIEPDGTRRTKTSDLRVYAHTEIIAMLKPAGLVWERTYGDRDLSDFGPESRGMAVVGRKANG